MSETAHQIDPVEPKKEKPSLFKVITDPGEQFSRIKENPKVLVPLLIVTVIYALWAAIMAFTTDFQALVGDIPNGGDAAFFAEAEGFIRMTTFITSIIMPTLGAVIGAFIMWIAVKLTAGNATYKQLFSLNVFISLIAGLGLLINILIATMFNLNPIQMITGLTVLFDPFDPLYAFIAIFEVFAFWTLILTALGLQIVASMRPATAWTVTLVITVGAAVISFLTSGM
ncbi:Yip1 family protein [Alkalihalophilus lindianensis]|uniref:Yip1 family protein n=1 Tax=Alkalihalophilus lindianensis TaxID=1630542 RepID=A0ABU3X4J9_9BACI|nr:Yip1 family protein [Alkalihalophilus lindianensis]MDV2682812.1 Yip1 family protein [Alkalihalophilus lindianensis]